MSITLNQIVQTPLRQAFVSPAEQTLHSNGGAEQANRLHHQTAANIAKAILDFGFGMKDTRVFFDIIDKHETSLSFDIKLEKTEKIIPPDLQAIIDFVVTTQRVIDNKKGVTVACAREESNDGVTYESPILAYDIREILPAFRQIAANTMNHCQAQKMRLCGLINDLQIELHREANPQAPKYNI